MKYLIFSIQFISFLLLVSCSSEIDEQKPPDETKSINDISDTTEIEYEFMQPKKLSAARGEIVRYIYNPLDITGIELGLMDLSEEKFPPGKFLFQEGQYIDKETIQNWLERRSEEYPEGLNPEIDNNKDRLKAETNSPKILSYILEQNYVNEDGKTKGISIGLSLHKVYYPRYIEDGLVYSDEVTIDDEIIINQGKKIANKFVSNIRKLKDFPNVPILLALYKEESKNSIKPGTFIAKTYIESDENTIDKWETLDKNNLLLTKKDLDNLEEKDPETYYDFEIFYKSLEKHFSGFNLSVYGLGKYENKELKKIDINVKSGALRSAQTLALVEYIKSLLSNGSFPENIPITIMIKDSKEKGIVKRDPKTDEISSHIY